jgi:hypothetical protein
MAFSDLTPCSMVGGYQHFEGTCYFHLQGQSESSIKLHSVTSHMTKVWNTHHCENLKSHIKYCQNNTAAANKQEIN